MDTTIEASDASMLSSLAGAVQADESMVSASMIPALEQSAEVQLALKKEVGIVFDTRRTIGLPVNRNCLLMIQNLGVFDFPSGSLFSRSSEGSPQRS